MLRLNVYCSLIPSARQVKVGSGGHGYGSWVIQCHRARNLSQGISVKALRDEMDEGTSGFPSRSWDPGLEIEVPFEQRPVNEYSSLKDGPLYSWGELSQGSFLVRLGGLWLVAFTVLGVPIAAASFNPAKGIVHVTTSQRLDQFNGQQTTLGWSTVTALIQASNLKLRSLVALQH